MRLLALITLLALSITSTLAADDDVPDSSTLAQQVTISRDEFGVPHIAGENDEATLFGFGYAQAEDFFWQVEDVYILALGRYSEAHGPKGLNSDLLNRAFEIVPRSQRDFAALDQTTRRLCGAFTAGINYYLAAHPEVRPRLIKKFEPWHVLAYHRQVALELCFRFTGLSTQYLPRRNPQIEDATGSNGWAIAGSRTKSGHTMLMAMPHLPWFGFTQLAEAHLSSGGGKDRPWNFSGAGFYGSPALALGHNDRLGWTLVTNRPDIADVWRERFDKPGEPLAYAYDGGHRLAEKRVETIKVRKARNVEERQYTFRKTHHGPIVVRESDRSMLAAQISGLFESTPLRQWLRMVRARNLEEFRTSLSTMQILYMNLLYADCEGNIWYVYTGRIPRRNPKFDWSQPVEGADPATEWLGVHELDELPQALNPKCGFLQNCNSTPWEVAANAGLKPDDYPSYMVGDGEVRNRRSHRSRQILLDQHEINFADWQRLAFDDVVPWARENLPAYERDFAKLEKDGNPLTERIRPYFEHLAKWDGRITAESTEATLCVAWYELMHGSGYPGEAMRPQFRGDRQAQLEALVRAAEGLSMLHGNWRVPYGELFRIQRCDNVADLIDVRFDDDQPSLPCLGGPGPMGAVFATYYSPSLVIPLVISQRKRYGVVGASYTAAWEFGPDGIRGASLVPFGASGNPKSPHYFDQAALLSRRRMKPELFTPGEVTASSRESYRPGERREKK
jgi:acyl-homoserine lactone acylase PvdQ